LGGVGVKLKLKLNSAQLKLELGLSLAKYHIMYHSSHHILVFILLVIDGLLIDIVFGLVWLGQT
jgi:hypothetical protein